MTDSNENQGNWNQPWLWFTLAPLILSVVLGLTMLNISFHIQDGLVTDEYSKEGLTINERIEKEELAKQLNTQVVLSKEISAGEISLQFSSTLEIQPDNLVLELIHPIIKDQDLKLVMTHQGSGRYTAQLDSTPDGKHYLRIQPLHNPDWVLKGEVFFPLSSDLTVTAD